MRLAGQIEERPCGMCGRTVRIKEHEDTVCECGFVVNRVERDDSLRGYE